MKKWLILSIVLVLIAIAALLFTPSAVAPVVEEDEVSALVEVKKEQPEGAPALEEVDITQPPEKETKSAEVLVTYTDSGFSPDIVTVNAGDTVTFLNSSTGSFWPASADHPTHTVYPGSGIKKCSSAAEEVFDACSPVASGGTYSFVFTEVGSWEYHDHLNAGQGGTVVVK